MRHRLVTAAAFLVPAVLVLGAAPAVAGGNPGGNNGTIKLSEVGGPENQSNDPKLSCSFEVQWYGFDAGSELYSDVSFAGQGADADVAIGVTGSTHVFIGEDAAGGGTDHDATQVYTLSFDKPAASANQGYHVKVTTANGGSKGNDTKSKVFHVAPCAAPVDPTPVDPTPADPTPADPTPADPTGPVTTDPSQPTPALVPWNWDWQYAAPTCDALTVDYPSNIPAGQANDVNIRFATSAGDLTLNFHNNTGTWGGRTVFTYAGHPQWPAGLTSYDVVWVQVGGTNYHWQGQISCGDVAPVPAAPVPAALAPAEPAPTAPAPAAAAPALAVQVLGFRSGVATVKRGVAPQADWIAVAATDTEVVKVQQLKAGAWKQTRTAQIDDGAAKVTYPRLIKRGTYKFRVLVDDVASKVLTVRVR